METKSHLAEGYIFSVQMSIGRNQPDGPSTFSCDVFAQDVEEAIAQAKAVLAHEYNVGEPWQVHKILDCGRTGKAWFNKFVIVEANQGEAGMLGRLLQAQTERDIEINNRKTLIDALEGVIKERDQALESLRKERESK